MSARRSIPTTTLQLLAPPAPVGQRTKLHDVIDLNVRSDHRLLLTVEEAADRLGIGRSLMYELLRDRQVTSVRIGRLRRVPAESLIEFVAGIRATANGPDPAA